MHLVDDIDLVATESGWHLHLLGELADVLYGVVRGSVQLEDVEGSLLLEGLTALAQPASLAFSGEVLAVDRPRQDARRRRLPHPTGATEEVRMGEFARANSGA